jgi:hypothetical protein
MHSSAAKKKDDNQSGEENRATLFYGPFTTQQKQMIGQNVVAY